MRRASLVVVCVCALVACTGVQVDKGYRQVRGFDDTEANEKKFASSNKTHVERDYRDEWRYNRHDTNRPPQLCLAMSGGGMRSAAFNIGVLQGLHRAKLLDQIDVMSSVSGGGYALSWYYIQQANTGATADELFDDAGRFQLYLSNNSNLAYPDPDSSLRWFNYVVEFGKWLPSWFAHIFANGVFDWHANLNPLRRTYENGIERVFHFSPASTTPEQHGFVNDAGFWSASAVHPDKKVTFPEMRELITQRRLPFFIINATMAIDDDPEHFGAEFNKSIYEFTPLRHGSDAFEARFTEFPFAVSRAVAISGAAKDSTTTPGAKRQLFDSMTNTDLGYFITNPSLKVDDTYYILDRALPVPFYLAVPNYRDAVGTDIYLTDGGHSDNLATYSLVRRMCGEIIVVDAEHDPKYEFEGLNRLKKRVNSEMGVAFNLDPPVPFDPAQPLMTGSIGSFPIQYSDSVRVRRNITVRYLKLSIDRNRLDQYSPTVREYYALHGEKGDKNNRFPQQSTSDINYNRGQFLAYRDLGADMVRLYLEKQMRSSPVSNEAQARPDMPVR